MSSEGKRSYKFGPFRIDPTERLLLRGERVVPLAPKAFDTLLVLVENSGHTVEKDELMRRLWPDSFVEESSLAQNIFRLRKALGEDPSEYHYIETIPKRGYRFAAPVTQSPGEGTAFHIREPSKLEQTKLHGSVPVIAVLPFKLLGADGGDESLGQGLADALITKLSTIRQIIVRPTTSILKYAEPGQDPLVVGRELDADFLLDGTIQQVGGRIRVSVQLVRVSNGGTLWADKFDEEFSHIFAMQDSISEQVIRALPLKLSDIEQKQLTKHYTENIEAYQFYTFGRYFWEKRAEKGYTKSIEYYQQAIRVDPDYALAHAGLADAYNCLGEYLYLPPEKSFPLAKGAAMKALELDGTLAEAHVSLAEVKMFYEWDWKEAEREFQLALRMNPNYAAAYHMYAWFLLTTERFDESLVVIKRARELDPLSLTLATALGLPFYYKRQYDRAIEQYQMTVEVEPNFTLARYYLGSALAQKGMYDEAIAEFKMVAPLEYIPQVLALLGHAYAASGKKQEALVILDRLRELSKQRYVSPYNFAIVYAGLGAVGQAFKWLEKAYEEHSAWLVFLKIEPIFDRLRRDSRFTDILRRVGFVA
jgi:DNA-binding winged helix-turn-helix (wHTH) protein/tetratricopeptide (TPR) repeat protein